MTIRNLAEVGARLEETVSGLPGDDADPLQQYLQYEMIAIQILDSEFENYPLEVLENYLKGYLSQKRLELGVGESQLK